MEILIAHNGQRLGPFSLAEVQGKIDAGELQRSDLAWANGKADWTPLEKFEGLVWPGPPAVPAPSLPRAQVPPPASLNTGYFPAPHAVPNSRPTSGLAITSLVSGILSITFVVPFISSIVAIVTGHMARAEIRRTNGAIGGDGMAVAGLVTGYAGLGIIVAFVGFFLIFGLAFATTALTAVPKIMETNALDRGHRLAAACRSYAADHHGAFPDELGDLVPKYLGDMEALTCQFGPTETAVPFKYKGGHDSDPGNNVLFYSENSNKAGKHVVGHVNGSVALEPLPQQVEKEDRHR
jgi:hypothetical protein